MRICIFGAGAVGGHMLARLSLGGAELCAVMRGQRLAAVREEGLRLKIDGEADLHLSPTVSDDPASLGVQDVMVMSVKLAALKEALAAARPLINDDTRVVFAMNGLPWWFPQGLDLPETPELAACLDPDGSLRRAVDVTRWVACVVTSGNVVERPGVVINTTPGRNKLRLGFSDGRRDAIVEKFVAAASRGGYDAEFSDDIRREMWSKLLINAGMSSVATVSERTIYEICNDPETRLVCRRLMGEILEIGNDLGVGIDADIDRLTDPATAPHHTTSFLQDLRSGRPLEISNGILAVRAIARAKHIAAPHLDTVAALMQARSSRFE